MGAAGGTGTCGEKSVVNGGGWGVVVVVVVVVVSLRIKIDHNDVYQKW